MNCVCKLKCCFFYYYYLLYTFILKLAHNKDRGSSVIESNKNKKDIPYTV